MHVLIVDDEEAIRDSLEMILAYEHYVVNLAANGREAMEVLEREPIDVVLLDIKMPDKDGIEVLGEIRAKRPECPVIMISGHGTIETAVEATKKGAFDFLAKPLDRDRVLVTLRNAIRQTELERQNRLLKAEVDSGFEILAESPAMLQILATIDRVARTDARVLVSGENGTGKELVARRVHFRSGRTGPFVDVNCAAIPGQLIESELFGHERGAFTGANALKKGKFELADKGTLFLDEIGDMSLEAQAKVLRVLEQQRIQRVGGQSSIQVDVRVVAATNKDLPKAVKAGAFREDLFYRLNVVPIHVPPLRERREDVAPLAAQLMEDAARRNEIESKKLSAAAVHALERHDWPGNVRELRNVVERLAILAPGSVVSESDVGAVLAQSASSSEGESIEGLLTIPTLEDFKERAEVAFLKRKLRENGWNIKRTAEQIQTPRSNLYKKLEKYDLLRNPS
ncbi:MAG: sigma-54-dependent Fis family transcriptional regulator [Planctomycetes bacterium]|nr:sigma-54-dependent Fis family transcriptional regulator [Planctomycetota bacterium]MBI3847505.1 sigma-54-dependent Fis family transcriptional regulator [Planctomycetota bacterium]